MSKPAGVPISRVCSYNAQKHVWTRTVWLDTFMPPLGLQIICEWGQQGCALPSNQANPYSFPIILFMRVCGVFCLFFSQLDATSITSLPQLFSLSSGPATQTHSAVCQSQQSPQKSNLPPLLMGCDIALIISRTATVGECGKQAVDTPLLLCQLSHSNKSEWITLCQINRLH